MVSIAYHIHAAEGSARVAAELDPLSIRDFRSTVRRPTGQTRADTATLAVITQMGLVLTLASHMRPDRPP
jgi:hypothetical protein